MTVSTITKNGRVTGWRPKRVYREVVCDWDALAPEDADTEPLKATIRDELTFREIAAIDYGAGVLYSKIWQSIAPYVIAWNVVGTDGDGNAVILPAPADVGPEIFGACPKLVTDWLAQEIKFGHLRGLEKKGSTTNDTPSGENGDA